MPQGSVCGWIQLQWQFMQHWKTGSSQEEEKCVYMITLMAHNQSLPSRIQDCMQSELEKLEKSKVEFPGVSCSTLFFFPPEYANVQNTVNHFLVLKNLNLVVAGNLSIILIEHQDLHSRLFLKKSPPQGTLKLSVPGLVIFVCNHVELSTTSSVEKKIIEIIACLLLLCLF